VRVCVCVCVGVCYVCVYVYFEVFKQSEKVAVPTARLAGAATPKLCLINANREDIFNAIRNNCGRSSRLREGNEGTQNKSLTRWV